MQRVLRLTLRDALAHSVGRCGGRSIILRRRRPGFGTDDVDAELHAFIADPDARSSNDLVHSVAWLSTERALGQGVPPLELGHGIPPSHEPPTEATRMCAIRHRPAARTEMGTEAMQSWSNSDIAATAWRSTSCPDSSG